MGTTHPLVVTLHQLVGTDHQLIGTAHPLVGTAHSLVGTDHPVVGTDHPFRLISAELGEQLALKALMSRYRPSTLSLKKIFLYPERSNLRLQSGAGNAQASSRAVRSVDFATRLAQHGFDFRFAV